MGMGGWWPFGGGKSAAPDMKAASRVQCYDSRDDYFFCLGAFAAPVHLCTHHSSDNTLRQHAPTTRCRSCKIPASLEASLH